MDTYESDDDLWSGEVRHVDIDALPEPLPHNKTAAAEPGQSADTDAAVAREVAAFLLQRRCIYKDKFYRGPGEVDTASTVSWLRAALFGGVKGQREVPRFIDSGPPLGPLKHEAARSGLGQRKHRV